MATEQAHAIPEHMTYVDAAWTMLWKCHKAEERESHAMSTKFLDISHKNHKFFPSKVSDTGTTTNINEPGSTNWKYGTFKSEQYEWYNK